MSPIRMSEPHSYDICDDYGVWAVVPRLLEANGRWTTKEEAKAECDRRNFEDGLADEHGKLLHLYNQINWWAKHSIREDCTCKHARTGDPIDRDLLGKDAKGGAA